jgi:hypothetical protein
LILSYKYSTPELLKLCKNIIRPPQKKLFIPYFLYILFKQSKNPLYLDYRFSLQINLRRTVSEGYVSIIADKDEKYARAHLYRLFLLFLKVSKMPK